MNPKWLKIAPKTAQDSPKWVHKGSQNDPKMVQDCLKLPKIYNIYIIHIIYQKALKGLIRPYNALKWSWTLKTPLNNLVRPYKALGWSPKITLNHPILNFYTLKRNFYRIINPGDVLVVALLDPRHPGPVRPAACQTGCLYVLESVAVAADAAVGCCCSCCCCCFCFCCCNLVRPYEAL